jgi:hypothetical protein
MIAKPRWADWVDENVSIDDTLKLREDAPEDIRKEFEEDIRKREEDEKNGIWR